MVSSMCQAQYSNHQLYQAYLEQDVAIWGEYIASCNWDSLSDEGKAILQRYEKAMGGEAIDWSDNLVQGTDANRTFHING